MNNKTRGRVRSKKLHQFDTLYIFYLLKPDQKMKYIVFQTGVLYTLYQGFSTWVLEAQGVRQKFQGYMKSSSVSK